MFKDKSATKNQAYATYKPCPAAVVDSPASKMRPVGQTHDHKYYMPKVSD